MMFNNPMIPVGPGDYQRRFIPTHVCTGCGRQYEFYGGWFYDRWGKVRSTCDNCGLYLRANVWPLKEWEKINNDGQRVIS